MNASHTPLLIVLALLLVCSALASASETALFGITHGQRASLRRSNPRLSRIIESLLAHPRELLMQVLLLNMVVNVSYFIVTSILTIRAETTTAQVVISVGSLAVIILIGEVFAKLFASSATILFLRFAAPVHLLIRKPIRSFLVFLDRWTIAPLARLLAPSKDLEMQGQVSSAQIDALISLSASDGVIDTGEQELLNAIVSMGQTRVEQIMTPRVDLAWISVKSSPEQIVEMCKKRRKAQVVVFEDGIDSELIGVVDIRKVLGGNPIKKVMRDPVFVPEQCRLDVLLERFTEHAQSVAIAVNEHGGVSGVITLADISKELIDASSSDDQDLVNEVIQIDDGVWKVPGRLSIRDWPIMFSDQSVIDHANKVNTLGGLVMVLLDTVPESGDQTTIGDLRLTVLEMDRTSIQSVEVRVLSHSSIEEDVS